jgi:hypothetical protein
MKLEIRGDSVYVTREKGDPILRPNTGKGWGQPGWWAAESRLLHMMKVKLNARGNEFIKKLMWRDGHLTDDHRSYLRTKGPKSPGLHAMIHHERYEVEIAAELFNDGKTVEFDLVKIAPGDWTKPARKPRTRKPAAKRASPRRPASRPKANPARVARKYVVVRKSSTSGPYIVERNSNAPRVLAWSRADIAGYASTMREAESLARKANARR